MKNFKMVALVLMASLMSLTAQATEWNTVNVTLAGTTDSGGISIKVSNVSGQGTLFTNRIFRMAPSIEKLGFVIGLAAVSSSRQVVIFSNIDEVDDTTHPIIQSVYLSSYVAIPST
jgi:hypothetical protein